MDEEVAAAMAEATRHCVDMVALQSRASEIIAEVTGAEAGFVTSGAAAGLLLGTAACVTGLDPAKMNRLPDTEGLCDEVVVVRSQRNFYDHSVRAAGVRLVEVGLADRYAGAGVRDAEAWEIAQAIGARTACVFYVAQPQSRPPLRAVVEVAHAAGVPVLVDAAAQLPPAENLRRFIDEGADLVAFSGGKAIGGPQGAGLLCGRRDLVAAAGLQNLDQDLMPEQWSPPPGLFHGLNLRGLPQHGIGRASKVGKEQVVGLLTALRRFAGGSDEAWREACERRLEAVLAELTDADRARMRMVPDRRSGEPRLVLDLGCGDDGARALAVGLDLAGGSPAVHADLARVSEGLVVMSGASMREEDPPIVARRLREVLALR
jgi:L-seryl-tRNA(Ser) seleniumtransferase